MIKEINFSGGARNKFSGELLIVVGDKRMHDKILKEMRVRVRAGRVAMSIHAIEEMREDGLTLDDLKQCVLTGGIIERQFDEVYDGYKYVIEGETLEVEEFIHVVAKLGKKNTVVITTYRIN